MRGMGQLGRLAMCIAHASLTDLVQVHLRGGSIPIGLDFVSCCWIRTPCRLYSCPVVGRPTWILLFQLDSVMEKKFHLSSDVNAKLEVIKIFIIVPFYDT